MLRRLAFAVFLLLTGLSLFFAFRDEKSVTTSSAEAYKHYLAGNDFYEKFYFRQAAREYEQAVSLDSNFALAEARLSQTYRNLGFSQKHDEMWKSAMAHRSKVSDREQLLLDLWKSEEGDNRDSSNALAEEYITKYPDFLDGYVNLANTEFARENWEHSMELNQKILKIDPTYANAYNMLGYLNYYLGRYDQALTSLERYIQICPNQANPHDSRGEILFARGRYDEALNEFREAFNINPDLDFPVLHMAATYSVLGELKQSDYCFQILAGQASNENMRNGYLLQKARLLIDSHKYEAAREIANRVIADDTEPEKANAATGVVLNGLIAYCQRDEKALKTAWEERRKYLSDLLEKRPGLAEQSGTRRAYMFLDATTADLEGDLQRASSLFAEYVDSTKNPSEKVNMRVYLADALWRQGKTDQAESELQKNLSVNPNHPRSLTLLADIMEGEGNKTAAADYRQRALAIWKNADPDYQLLADLQKKMNSAVASTATVSSDRP